MVCIIDDREDVWDYASNLIHVKPYHFFQHTGDIHAPPGLTKCENDENKEGFDFSQFDKSGAGNNSGEYFFGIRINIWKSKLDNFMLINLLGFFSFS